jgi:hypothetical protein
MSKSSRRKFLCLDCRIDTGKIHEHYFIQTPLWMKLVGSNQGMLCVGCLELRLGRKLIASDFTNASINTASHEAKSQRLMERLTTCR